MGADQVLVAIQPQELTFTFELKKQSSCSVQLVNKSKDYVAFKVKTTSPKRYCVRPNTGIILPRSTCDFTVTMQAPKEAPPGMQLKDKFLVQSTVVPYGTTDEDIVPSFFSKENGRYIQENKLKVVLVSPPHSPVVKPINGALKQEPPYENPDSAETCISNNGALQHELAKDVPTLRTSISDNGAVKQESIHENPMLKETCSSSDQALNEVTDIAPDKEVPVLRETSISDNGAVKEGSIHENPMLKETCISSDQALSGAADISPSHVVKDIDDLKLKLTSLEVKLNEAEKTIMLLQRENSAAFHEREKLQQEIALLRSKSAARIRAGFPFLFVVFMALVGMALGYLLHS